MENQNLKLSVHNSGDPILIGQAAKQSPEFREKEYNIVGGPGTCFEVLSKGPLNYYVNGSQKMIDLVGHFSFNDDVFLTVNRDEHRICLAVNSNESSITDVYTSALKLSKELSEFGINTGKSWITFELAHFIKMNRSCFESKASAMELVSVLQNFKAKVDKDIENTDDTRGNKKLLLQQTVDSNLPESFKVTIPIFKGIENQTIEVEVMIDASDFSCQLISPEAKDFIDNESDKILNDELDKIEKMHSDLKIIELV